MKKLAYIIASLFLLTGCANHVFKYPVAISTKSCVYQYVAPIENVRTEYSEGFILVLPLVDDHPKTFEKLLEKAEKTSGEKTLVDVQISSKSFFSWPDPDLPLLYYDTKIMSGSAAKLRKLPLSLDE